MLASYHLGPLTREETRAYVLHRLGTVGWHGRPRWDEAAFAAAFEHSGGLPRRINRLCSRVLLYGALEETDEITRAMVDTTAEELAQDLEGGRPTAIAQAGAVDGHAAAPGLVPGAMEGGLARAGLLTQELARLSTDLHAELHAELDRESTAVAELRQRLDAGRRPAHGAARPGVPEAARRARRARRRLAMSRPANARPVNAFTVDVKDFFHVQAFADVIPRSTWDELPRRVEQNTERLLELCDRAGVAGTFFTLGWVAARHAALVRRIVAAGHELASHGFAHQRVDTLGNARRVPRRHRSRENPAGRRGRRRRFRLPPPTFFPEPAHALGFFNSRRNRAPLFLVGLSGEARPVRVAGRRAGAAPGHRHGPVGTPDDHTQGGREKLAVLGGRLVRLLPVPLFRLALRRCNRAQGTPALFYTHPWEVDPEQPRVAGAGRLARFRHYNNLAKTLPRLERLLADFAWDRMDRVYAPLLAPG